MSNIQPCVAISRCVDFPNTLKLSGCILLYIAVLINCFRLIAIMLGRLRMSLDDCEVTFRDFCEKIYRPKDPNDQRRDPAHHHYRPSKFDLEVLEKTVKDMIRKKIPIGEKPEEALLKDLDTSCKV